MSIYKLYKVYNKCSSYFTNEEYRTIFIVGQGGVGKSYIAFTTMIYDSIFKKEPFALVVENSRIVQKLSSNNGIKFFTRLIKGWRESEYKKEKRLYNKIKNCKLELVGGAFLLDKEPLGYILSYNDYSNDKGSNIEVNHIVIDEFIPVKLTYMNRDIDKKVASVIESVGRDNIKTLTFLANPIRLNNPLMVKFGFDKIKQGETIVKKSVVNPGKVNAVCHYIDPSKFKKITEYKEKTASGEFAIITNNSARLYGTQEDIDTTQTYVPKPRVQPFMFVNIGAYLVFYNCNNSDKSSTVTVHLTQEKSKGLVQCQLTTPIKGLSSPRCLYNKNSVETLLNIWQHKNTKYTSESAFLALKDYIKGLANR